MPLDAHACASRGIFKFIKTNYLKHQGVFQKALHLFKKSLEEFKLN